MAYVDLAHCVEGITDLGVAAVAHFLGPRLTNLNLRGCKRVSNIGVALLAYKCPNLVCIELAWLVRVTGVAISALAAGCPRLTKLNMTFCAAGGTPEAMCTVAECCVDLTYVDTHVDTQHVMIEYTRHRYVGCYRVFVTVLW